MIFKTKNRPTPEYIPYLKTQTQRLHCSLSILTKMPTLPSRKEGGFKPKIGRFSKLHVTSMAQSLPEIGRLPNLGVKMDKSFYKNREPPY